jgi:hypothetical protein
MVMGEELLSLPELNLMQPAESFLRAALAFSLVGDLLELGDWKKSDATARKGARADSEVGVSRL